MLQFFDTLTDDSGNALLGATITVTNFPSGTLASIYSTNGTTAPIANSVVAADITGQVSFYIPDGPYTFTYAYKGTNYKVRSPVQLMDPMGFFSVTDTGIANAYVVASSILPAQLVTGMKLEFRAAHTNSGLSTLAFQGGAPQPINQPGGAGLISGMIQANGIVRLEWDGAQWQLIGSQSQPFYAQTAAEAAGGIVPANTAYPTNPGLNVLRYAGVVDDGVTDCTAALLTAMNAIGGTFVIPPRVLYDTKTLLATLSTAVIIIDDSVINDYTSAGQTAKRVGITASDTSVNDSAWYIASGHHPGLTLNNFGTAGTASAASRVQSIDYMAGQFRNGGLSNRGARFAAHETWSKDGNVWAKQLISDAPWLAIAAEYELWSAGMPVTAGVTYCVNASNIYVSAVTGNASATPPTHGSGTANGWTWSDSVGRNVARIDENGRTLYGSGAYTYQWNYYGVTRDADGGQVAVNWQAAGVSKKVIQRWTPTDGAAAASNVPFMESQDAVGLRFFNSGKTRELLRLTETDTRFPDTQVDFAVSATAPDPGNGGTINTANVTVARVQPVANRTTLILQAGTVAGQMVFVENNSAFTCTFDVAATSNVADGATSAIPALTGRLFMWSAAAGRWFRAA